MYKYGAEFTGTDISENQIEQARLMFDGMNINYITASAEAIDFPDSTFDVVTACQCFMYFNKETVLPKIHNLLKPDGHLCILFMTYLPFESEIAEKSEELILKYNPDWNGRMKACRGIGASSLGAEKISEWETEHMTYLQTMPENFDIPHWVTVLNLKKI